MNARETKEESAQNDVLNPEKKQEKKSSAREAAKLSSLRERLYERGNNHKSFTRHSLASENRERRINEPFYTPHGNRGPEPLADRKVRSHTAPKSADEPLRNEQHITNNETVPTAESMIKKDQRRSYRWKIAIVGLIFFLGALLVSSAFLFLGHNTISGENITIGVSGPIAVGGGDELDFQVAISNQNTVSIESATLIVKYPLGTQSVSEKGKEIQSVRQPLQNIGSGQLINVPMSAIVFGEENDEKTIEVSIEYRVGGSNATFYKEASPFKFKIGSSPILLDVDGLKSISTGQEGEYTITLQSNAPTALQNIVLEASYPAGFEYASANPAPEERNTVWRIGELKPGEKRSITIKGIFTAKDGEKPEFTFSAGSANSNQSTSFSSILSMVKYEVAIEQPFLKMNVSINGSPDNDVVLASTDPARIIITFKNTLETSVFDGVIQVALSGNALDEGRVEAEGGFYDSSRNIASWDSAGVPALKEIKPRASNSVTLNLNSHKIGPESPEIKLAVTVQGQRVFEDRVPEILRGTSERIIRFKSVPVFDAEVLSTKGPFTNQGPTPPVAEEKTQYTYHFIVKTGVNGVTSAEVTTTIPQYIEWLDRVDGDANVTYDASSRLFKWKIGSVGANETREAWVQVSFKPSLAQVGKTPILLQGPLFKATDAFTGTVISSLGDNSTTELYDDPDLLLRDGTVREQ